MTPNISSPFSLLKDFAAKLTDVFALPMHFNQEDQLKGPMSALVERLGVRLGLVVATATEIQEKEIFGRPDMGVAVDGLLTGHIELKAPGKGADPKVITLDPACGTGTYVLAALRHSLEKIAATKGAGMKVSAATTAAARMHAFEILVGPYAVAHLRLTQQLVAEGGTLPDDGVHVYLRSWPISESPEVLKKRWSALLATTSRGVLFKETRDRKVSKPYFALDGGGKLSALGALPPSTAPPEPQRYAYRSFDRPC